MATQARVITWLEALTVIWAYIAHALSEKAAQVVPVRTENIATSGDYFGGYNIHDVLASPAKFQKHYENILKANLNLPILLRREDGGATHIPVDGIYRIGKALLEGRQTVQAVSVWQAEIESLVPGVDNRKFWPQHQCRQCGDPVPHDKTADQYICGEMKCVGPQ
jgi:hypothetical protein